MAVVIDSVQRATVGTVAKMSGDVREEVLQARVAALPAFADLDASASPIVEVRELGAVAPSNHFYPRAI